MARHERAFDSLMEAMDAIRPAAAELRDALRANARAKRTLIDHLSRRAQ